MGYQTAKALTDYLILRAQALADAGPVRTAAGQICLPGCGRIELLVQQILMGAASGSLTHDALCWEARNQIEAATANLHPFYSEAVRCYAQGLVDLDVSWDQVQDALLDAE